MSRTLMRSFGGGEIAPLLHGRLDLAKHQTGLAKCLNFQVTPQGPVENRAGYEYVLKAKQVGACLLPFSYNSEQTFALEFGPSYIRFHTGGATLLEAAQSLIAVTVASPGEFGCPAHGYSNGEWVYLASIGGMPLLSGRFGIVTNATANTFTLTDLFGTAINTTGMPAYTGGGTVARVYEIASPYLAADLFDLHYEQSADVLTITHQGYVTRELRRLGATNWALTTVSFVPTIGTPAAPTVTTGGPGGGTPSTHTYVCTAIASGTLEESLASASANASLDLTVSGNYIDVDPPAVSGAVRYNIYKAKGGVYGYIGQTDGSALRDENIDPDMSKTPPLTNTPFASENARAVAYHEQRRCFGGGGTNPQNIWTTRSGTEANMTYSIPSQDDDAVTARIVARQAQQVRHLVALGDLLALTSGGVWRIAAAGGDVLTPSSFSVKPQGYVGASNVQPMVGSQSVLYVADRGSHVREVSYRWETQTYQSEDISVLAPHLVDFHDIVQLAYARAPTQILWGVRSDGVLLGLTHMPEHDIKAWHQHAAGGSGLFKSVCSVAEGDEDGTYVIVARTINGQAVEYIERQHSRQFDELEDAFFVDSGLSYEGVATDTITGLWHLEGESVVALAGGAVEPAQTVTDGSITLETDVTVAHVGLAYDCDFKTLPLALEAAALGQGSEKNVNEIFLRVHQSSGVRAGPSFTALRAYPQRSQSDPYGSAPGMVSDTIGMRLDPSWQQDGSVCVRQSDPLPLSILGVALEIARGG